MGNLQIFKIVFTTYCETINSVYHQLAYTKDQVNKIIFYEEERMAGNCAFVELPENYFGGN